MLAGEDPIQNQSALEEVSVDLTVLLPLVWNVAILADRLLGTPVRTGKRSLPVEIGQDPSDHRDREHGALASEQPLQFRLAPARVALAHAFDREDLVCRPGRQPFPFGTARPTLQRLQMQWVVATFPPIEGLAADPKVAAREAGVP